MPANASWLQSRREAAWAFGREHCDRLLQQYGQRYGGVDAPPAMLIHELMPEFLGAKLEYHPLPLDRFAETRVIDGEVRVTVNSELRQIDGVKDAEGVENVAMWHEAIHVIRDIDSLIRPATQQLPGFEEPPAIVCYRAAGVTVPTSGAVEREFWAEEAGRAAAVSVDALRRTEPFRELIDLGRRTVGPIRSGWPLLYRSAHEISVNISALTKQLSLEGMIVIQGGDVYVQPDMAGRLE